MYIDYPALPTGPQTGPLLEGLVQSHHAVGAALSRARKRSKWYRKVRCSAGRFGAWACPSRLITALGTQEQLRIPASW